jgi:hypothetical protein
VFPVGHLKVCGAFVSCAVLVGCGGGLRLQRVAAAHERPANVYVLLSAEADGAPADDLTPDQFEIEEDGRPVTSDAERKVARPDFRFMQFTSVAFDFGERPAPHELEAFAAIARAFVERAGSSRRLAFYVVDGSPEPAVVAPFGADKGTLEAAAARLKDYRPRDPSRDLNGSYAALLRSTRAAMQRVQPAIGNVVLVGRGPDRAHRAKVDAVEEEVRKFDGDLRRWLLALGQDAAASLNASASRGSLFSDGPALIAGSVDDVPTLADRLAASIEARGKSFYLIAMCSAARAGTHRVRIRATRPVPSKGAAAAAPEGPGTKAQTSTLQSGTLAYEFVADGFGPGCKPHVPTSWKYEDK